MAAAMEGFHTGRRFPLPQCGAHVRPLSMRIGSGAPPAARTHASHTVQSLQMELGAATPPRAAPRSAAVRHEVSGARRVRRIAMVASVVALIPALFSFMGALSASSNAPVGIRTVEWLRDHGAAGLVA